MGTDSIIVDIENAIKDFLGYCFIHLGYDAKAFMFVDRRHTLWDISQYLMKDMCTYPVIHVLIPDCLIRLGLRFGCLKDVYPVKTEKMEVTVEEIEEMKIDPDRWMEVPYDYGKFFTVGDIEKRTIQQNQSDHIEI